MQRVHVKLSFDPWGVSVLNATYALIHFPTFRGVLINLEDHRHHRPIPSFC